MSGPAGHPTNPLWERLTAYRDPNVTRQQVRDAGASVYSPEQIAALDATGAFPNWAAMQQTLAPIQQRLQTDALLQAAGVNPRATKGAGQSGMVDAQGNVIRSMPAYNGDGPAYHNGVVAPLARAATAAGLPGAASAVIDVGNTHSKNAAETILAKRAKANGYLDAMPPAIASVPAEQLPYSTRLNQGHSGGGLTITRQAAFGVVPGAGASRQPALQTSLTLGLPKRGPPKSCVPRVERDDTRRRRIAVSADDFDACVWHQRRREAPQEVGSIWPPDLGTRGLSPGRDCACRGWV